jgi:hypothetical protein
MATVGQLIENSESVQYFINVVQTPAHNQIVYWDNNRHTLSGIVAPPSEYFIDNPPTGVSVAGLGNDGTIVTASTVFNHLVAATFNITNIRLSAANFFLRIDNFSPDTPPQDILISSVGPSVTVRPTGFRQGFGVANAGVQAGNLATAASYNNFCTNLFNTWSSLRNNRSDFNVIYCHSSCHTNCHTSRGRR